MNFYKKIDIDHYDIIIEKCLAYIKTINDTYSRKFPMESWYSVDLNSLKNACPELELAFQKYDLKIIMAAIFIMYSPKHSTVHVDGYSDQARVNLPLLNCKNTYTNFYASDKAPVKWINPESGEVSFVPHDDYTLVDKVELTQATVLRTKALHHVDMPLGNPVPRITLTLGFNKDPVYLLD